MCIVYTFIHILTMNNMHGDQGVYDEYIRILRIVDPGFTDWSWLASCYDQLTIEYYEAEGAYNAMKKWEQREEFATLAKKYSKDRTRTEILEIL